MSLGLQRIARRDLADVSAGNSLHAVKVKEGRASAGAVVRREFETAKIRHAMADMDGQSLDLHPPHIAGLFVNGCNVHCDLSTPSKTSFCFHTGLEPIRYELQGQLLMGWFISGHLTSIRPRPEPCRARSMGLWLVGRRPVLSEGGYSNSPDLNAPSRSCARALHDSASVASA